ncbi:MAG: hypothetical protein PF518_15260, partial [Spirochaetaceae bacterium]|nr:hypothetical protein [Spirochaetaceae bacterium]
MMGLKNITLLLIEPDGENLKKDKKSLEQIGYSVLGAKNENEVLQHLRDIHEINIVLVAVYRDKDFDALQIAEFIQNEKKIPILFRSGESSPDLLEKTINIP